MYYVLISELFMSTCSYNIKQYLDYYYSRQPALFNWWQKAETDGNTGLIFRFYIHLIRNCDVYQVIGFGSPFGREIHIDRISAVWFRGLQCWQVEVWFFFSVQHSIGHECPPDALRNCNLLCQLGARLRSHQALHLRLERLTSIISTPFLIKIVFLIHQYKIYRIIIIISQIQWWRHTHSHFT